MISAAKAPRGRRLSAEARWMLSWCVALSAMLHVLLLTALTPAPRPGGWASHAGGRRAPAFSVRLITQDATPVPGMAQPASVASGASSAPPVPASAASMAASEPLAVASSSLSEAASSTIAAASAQGEADATAAAGAVGEVGAAPADGYVPRPQLSIAPEPAIPVVIATPPATAGTGRFIGRYSGVLVLYIDEQGRVRRIEAEPPVLPEAMERAAREAFLGARFSPGQVDGHVVKSRIRVEVVFDDGPLPVAPAASAASATRGAASAASAAGGQRAP